MKHIIYATLGATMFVPALIGCTEKTSDNKLKTIFVEQSFEKPDFDELSSKIEVLEVFRPEFTDSTMFSNPSLLAIRDGKAYLHEENWMAVYEYPSGKLLDAFNHYGPGPEEYQYSYHTYYADNEWTVLDMNFGRHNIRQYATDGKYIGTVVNDSIQSLSPIAGGWLAYNRNITEKNGFSKVREKKIYQYTPDWQLVHTYDIKERRWGAIASDRMDFVSNFNGISYVSDTDTIYSIDTDNYTLTPRIAIDLGKYAYDWGSLEQREEVREAEKSHFSILGPVFNSRYFFARYSIYFDRPWVLHYDVYDLDNGELVYRHNLSLEGEYGMCQFFEGIPVELDGETVYGWPIEYVEDDAFYVIIASDELTRIYDTDAINPVFVKIRIKD